MTAAGLASRAAAGSPRYVALAGLVALLAGGLLLLAGIIRLGSAEPPRWFCLDCVAVGDTTDAASAMFALPNPG